MLALAGHQVHLGDVDHATTKRAKARLVDQARDFESRGLFADSSSATLERNLVAAPSIEEAVSAADYITEAVPEALELKLAILQRISAAAHAEAIIGTNTSALSITRLSAAVVDASRFLGVHWMNPAPFVPGVELIPGQETAHRTVDTVETLVHALGKTPARVADTPGFVANRLQFALYKEAVRVVEEGIATPAQIDAVVSNTFGFRLALFGPFAIGDMAGLDVYDSSYRTLEDAYGERFASPQSLASSVAAGNLGLKSGHGFLDIEESRKPELLAYRDEAYARLSQLRAELGAAPGL